MSKAASAPRRLSSKSKPLAKALGKGYLPDRIVGVLAMVLDAVALVLLGMLLRGVSHTGLSLTRETMLSGGALGVGLIAHYGVFRGMRWGLAVAALLAAWGLVESGVPHGMRVVFSTNLWMLLYAAFRLGSTYGPKAR